MLQIRRANTELAKSAGTLNLARMLIRRAILFLLLAWVSSATAATAAESRLRGSYTVSLGGIFIGSGSWDVQVTEGHFAISGNGRTGGLLRLFSSGRGAASVSGDIRDGRPVAAEYDYASMKSTKFDEVRLRLRDGTITEWSVEPSQDHNRRRIALESQHRTGVHDPLSAVLLPVADPASPMGPDACRRTLPVFDGRMRYDLAFTFKRPETAITPEGYQGPVVVCAVRFFPIAGHVPQRPAIRYLAGLESMEMWLAPMAGTRFLVPWRVVIPTPFGTAVLAAESFVAGP